MKIELKHWTSELLTLFGVWLWDKKEYGHALLCIHGPQWGYKVSHQLKITWYDVLNSEDYEVLYELMYPDKFVMHRPIDEMAREYIEKAYQVVKFENWEDSIYVNAKTGKPLTTSSLNRELQRFAKQFLKELEEKSGQEIHLKPIKSNAFQIAWALKTLERYHYSKRCFVEISKFMGHRTLKDTTKLLGVEPFDSILYDFHGVFVEGDMTKETLDDKQKLEKYIRLAQNDAWTRFNDNVAE